MLRAKACGDLERHKTLAVFILTKVNLAVAIIYSIIAAVSARGYRM